GGRERGARSANVGCPSGEPVYRVDPAKVPAGGVRARCAVCSTVFGVSASAATTAPPVPAAQRTPAAPAGGGNVAAAPAPPAPPRAPVPPPAPPRAPAAPPPRLSAPLTATPRAARPGGRGTPPTHHRTAAAGQPVHGPGPEAKGAATGPRPGLGSGRVPSGEAPAGAARRYVAAALPGRDRKELAGIRRAGGGRSRQDDVVLGGGVERDPGRRQQDLLGRQSRA